jgi:hypothetical protein
MRQWLYLLWIGVISLVSTEARADDAGQSDDSSLPTVFISDVELITSWREDASVDRSLIESFKELLRLHGYQTDECQENTAAWLKIAERAGTQGIDKYREIDQRLVAAQKCNVPSTATRSYSVKLVLDHDKLLKNRRAVLHLVALGNYASLDGGYAHKPGELAGWYDIMNRAIDRALNRYNDHTTIRVSLPEEAVVGETIVIDGRNSWDPDGDAFELRWKVTVDACFRGTERVPADGFDCPEGMQRGDAVVYEQAASHDLSREFKVPMVGDYKVMVQAKIGAREEPPQTFSLRAYPARNWAFSARVSFFPLPQYYLSDSRERQTGISTGFSLQRRFFHRVGLMGWYEEIALGLSLDTLNQASTYNYEGRAQALFMGFQIIGRTLNRTGRYGLASNTTFGAVVHGASRGGQESEEWGWFSDALLGFYYAFTDNYVDRRSKLCATVCPSIVVGPTLKVLNNVDARIRGASFGLELVTNLEF